MNQAPTVSLTAPAANATAAAGESITITATAADSDGTVAAVEFYDGATKLGEDTTAPYEFVWTNPGTGAHTITVRAVDNAGASAVSSSVPVTVSAPPPANQAPTIAITAPTTNFKANAPATVKLVANAADADGTVAEVKFYRVNGAALTLLGAGALVGGSYELNQTLTAGTYDIVAVVKDDAGASTQSGTVRVIVNALPTANITSPVAGASIKVGSNVTLRATASDPDGSISKLEFFLDGSTTALGQAARVGTTTEYTLAWNNVPVGAHTLVARATDNDGAVFSTGSLSVNVAANASPTITLDAPTAGTNVPTTLTLTASAADSDGTVTSVQFFNGAALLGSGTLDVATSKYRLQVPLTAAQAGTYTITARVTDDQGAQTTTASRSITVAANVPPAVALGALTPVTLPVNSTTGTVALAATASDTDGIAKVEFFNGATKVGEDTTSPYQFNWTGVAAGSYSITAKATDTVGSTTTSTAQALVVTANTEGPWANLSAAQKGGITAAPNSPVEAGTIDAIQVLTALGTNKVTSIWRAAMGQAAKTLASSNFALTTGPIACAAGGEMQIVPGASATQRLVSFNNCVIGGFTFYGGVNVPTYAHPGIPAGVGSTIDWTQTAGGFTLAISGVRVTGNGAPEAGTGAYPNNALIGTTVTCTGSGASLSCLTTVATGNNWGTDLAWTNFAAGALVPPAALYATDDNFNLNGAFRFSFAPTSRNIRFENFTATNGRAIVYGDNGWSVVTRLAPLSPGVEQIQVKRFLTAPVTVGGITYAVGAGPTELYRCEVDANGDWGCTLIVTP
ncbi:MAG: hypothetical protein JNN03_18250 [Rubrivivax sp.]|nr:hypothetical protein [Rubrivivax sp.]